MYPYLIVLIVLLTIFFVASISVLITKKFFKCNDNHYSLGKIFNIFYCSRRIKSVKSCFNNVSTSDIDFHRPLSIKSESVSHNTSNHRIRILRNYRKNRNRCPTYNATSYNCQHDNKLPAYLRKHSNECRLKKTLQILVRAHYHINFPYNDNSQACYQSVSEHYDALSQNNSLFGIQGTSLNDFPLPLGDNISGDELIVNPQSELNDCERYAGADADSAFDCVSIPIRDDLTCPPPSYEEAIRRICHNLDNTSCNSEDYRRLNNHLVWATLCDCGICDDLIRPQNRRSVCQECYTCLPSDEVVSILSHEDDIASLPSVNKNNFVKIDFDYLLLKLLESCNQRTYQNPIVANKRKNLDEKRHVSYVDQQDTRSNNSCLADAKEVDAAAQTNPKNRSNVYQSSLSLFQPGNLYPLGEYIEENLDKRKNNVSEDSISRYSVFSNQHRPSCPTQSSTSPQNDILLLPSSYIPRKHIRLVDHEARSMVSCRQTRDGLSFDNVPIMSDGSVTLNTLPDTGSSQDIVNGVGINDEIDSIDFERHSNQTRPSMDSTSAMAGSLIVPSSQSNVINPETDSIIQSILCQEKSKLLMEKNIILPSFDTLKTSTDKIKPPPPYSQNEFKISKTTGVNFETTSLNFVPTSLTPDPSEDVDQPKRPG